MFKKVLVPVDISLPEETRSILAAAKTLTALWDCELHVMTVVPDMKMPIVSSYFNEDFEAEARTKADSELKQALTDAGLDATDHVATGTVYDKVIAEAEALDADLILISAHSPDLRDYLLGSNAARIVRHSKRSVLVLRD